MQTIFNSQPLSIAASDKDTHGWANFCSQVTVSAIRLRGLDETEKPPNLTIIELNTPEEFS